MRDDDVYWCTARRGWITGHTYGIYGPLSLGATTLMFEGVPHLAQADRYWRIVEKFLVNIFYTCAHGSPLPDAAGEAWAERYDLRSLRILGSVGEPINPRPGSGIIKISAAASCLLWIPGGRQRPAGP